MVKSKLSALIRPYNKRIQATSARRDASENVAEFINEL